MKQRWGQENRSNSFWSSSSLVVSTSLLNIWKLWNSFKTLPIKKLLEYILKLGHVSFSSKLCKWKKFWHTQKSSISSSDSQRIFERKSKLIPDNSLFPSLGVYMKQSIVRECLNQNQSLDLNHLLCLPLGAVMRQVLLLSAVKLNI